MGACPCCQHESENQPFMRIEIDRVDSNNDDSIFIPNDLWERQKCIMAVMYPQILLKEPEIATIATTITRQPTMMYIDMMAEGETCADLTNRLIAEKQKHLDMEFIDKNKQLLMENKHHKFVQKYNMEKHGQSDIDQTKSETKRLNIPLDLISDSTHLLLPEQASSDNCKLGGSGCTFTTRVIAALQFYQSLDVINNENDKTKLVQFCHEHRSLLDDYIHILMHHNNEDDLEQIFSLLMDENDLNECNVMHCAVTLRHYRDRRVAVINDELKAGDEDVECSFYQDIMDEIHCYLYHLFDTALRVKRSEIKQQSNDIDTEYIDEAFVNMYNIIKEKKKALMEGTGIDSNRLTNNKYNVIVTEDTNTKGTLMDNVIALMSKRGPMDHTEMKSLWQKIQEEEYDSDAIEIDINLERTSNIEIFNKNAHRIFKECLHYHKLSQYTFNIGYRFYYWNYYLKQHKANEFQWYDNINEHGGYDIAVLCVQQKYKNLKEEILNNKLLTLNMIEFELSVHKTNKYAQAKYAKTMTATPDYGDQLFQHDRNDDLHFGIAAGTPISFHHLLSVILYCDWSDLCTKFSASFRNKQSYDAIADIKNNNREYANWSRLLREVVEIFGFNHAGQYKPKSDGNRVINRLKGPFFCGMSFVMVIPEFSIRLCGPTSTSKQIEVSMRFGGRRQLNNTDLNLFSDNVCAFPCFWLSTYSGEDEYLFCGGRHKIRIETITIIDTKQNFEKHFSALFHFECLLNGTEINDDASKRQLEYECMNHLIKHKLKLDGFQNTYPKYINDTFEAFLNHKTQIVINLSIINAYRMRVNRYLTKQVLKKGNEKLSDFIIGQFYSTYATPTHDVQISQNLRFNDLHSKETEKTNSDLFKPLLFRLLNNINQIIIYSTSIWGNEEYAMNLSSLASSIFNMAKKDIKIEVKAVNRYGIDKWRDKETSNSWLCKAIIDNRSAFDFKLSTGINGIGRGEDCVEIVKKQLR